MPDELEEMRSLVEALRRKVNSTEDDIHDRLDKIEERLTALERCVNPDPERLDYDELSKERKVYRIRSELVQKAAATNGRWAMGYRDIQALFNGHPSAGHCYDLMKAAAQMEGFAYDQANASDASAETGNWRVRVEIEDVNEPAVFHSAKNGFAEEGA